MIALVAKELRQLIPFALIWFCLLALFYGAELYTLRVDESSYASWCGEYCNAGANTDVVLFNILLFMIAAYSLFPREFDESTVDFLRSLPMARSKIFVSKIIAILLLLWSLLLIDWAVQALILSTNTQTISGKRYFRTDWLFYVRDCLFAFVIVSHGVFVSWFRTAGLLIYSGYLLVLVWLEQALLVSGVYSIFGFYSNEYDGSNLIIDWVTVSFHVVVGLILLLISYLLWNKTDSRPRAPGTGKLAKVLPVMFSFLAFGVAGGLMLGMMGQNTESQEEEGIARLKSDHYAFSYRQSDEIAMRTLEPFAEQDYAALAKLLNAETDPVIQADMTSDSDHALGLASWKKIRMVLTTADEVDPLYRRVLSHETAHVFQSVESNRAFAKVGDTVNFFIEGMAQYTSFNIVPDESARESNWLISSVAWQRHNIKFPEMASRRGFSGLYDAEMLYGIGDIWVEAMVRTCGEDSIGEFLRAAGRDDAPTELSGSLYWRNHLQHIGCELEQVNNQWRNIMRDIAEQRTIGAFPTFENVVISRNDVTDMVSVVADLKAAESGQLPKNYYIRVQSEVKLASTVSQVIPGRLILDGENARVEFSVLGRLIDGQRFRFQMGYTPLPDSRNYFDKWRSGSLAE